MKFRFFTGLRISQSQRIGLGVLLGLFLGGMITTAWFIYHNKRQQYHGLLQQQKDKIAAMEKSPKKKTNTSYFNLSKKFSPFAFDPNTLEAQEWIKMGFSEKQTRMIVNYRNKGGHFRIKSDLHKLYCIDDDVYHLLKPYILLPDEIETTAPSGIPITELFSHQKKTTLRLNLNTCDSIALKSLKGIGVVLSKRIIKYRNALGGFHDVLQLSEVYGLSAETFSNIVPHVFIENATLRFLYINKESIETLNAHPYLDYYQAKSICSYRMQHKNIHNMEELSSIPLIDDSTCKKIAPYLRFDTIP